MSKTRQAAVGAAISIALLLCGPAAAQTFGKTAGGVPYVSGGVTVAELEKLAAQREKYSFWLTTAALRSGAHLSDVNVKITEAESRKVVLDTMMIGPWLLIDLPLGAYTVEATFQDQTQKHMTRIHPGDNHQMIMYFKIPAEVSPDWRSPFEASPYSGKGAKR
jgi:hypothetical protein